MNCGLPCIAVVTHYTGQLPDRSADNPDDYYGYVEVEFELLTTKGKPAPWLEKVMTEKDKARIESEIEEAMYLEYKDKSNDD